MARVKAAGLASATKADSETRNRSATGERPNGSRLNIHETQAGKSYVACTTRRRRTRSDIATIRTAIHDLLKNDHPQTVRQVFYQLVARGVIEKTEAQYQRTVIRLLGEMRLADKIPWDWIIDESRKGRVTQTYDNVTDALRATAKFYRRSALRESDVYIEIWSEKEALAGIIWEAASEYDVPIEVSKGMPSLTQVWGTACAVINAARHGKRSYIYQFGDHDPTGCLIPKSLEKLLQEFCSKYHATYPIVERAALTKEQIAQYSQPAQPSGTAIRMRKTSRAVASNWMHYRAAYFAN